MRGLSLGPVPSLLGVAGCSLLRRGAGEATGRPLRTWGSGGEEGPTALQPSAQAGCTPQVQLIPWNFSLQPHLGVGHPGGRSGEGCPEEAWHQSRDWLPHKRGDTDTGEVPGGRGDAPKAKGAAWAGGSVRPTKDAGLTERTAPAGEAPRSRGLLQQQLTQPCKRALCLRDVLEPAPAAQPLGPHQGTPVTGCTEGGACSAPSRNAGVRAPQMEHRSEGRPDLQRS